MLTGKSFIIPFFSWHFQEYERAVVYRLGLCLPGALRGPGIFFIVPCIDTFEKIDMRTQNFIVPPQDVGH